jgi:hypothetical protein
MMQVSPYTGTSYEQDHFLLGGYVWDEEDPNISTGQFRMIRVYLSSINCTYIYELAF